MDYKYFVCVTDEGRKLIANAIATETNIDFTHMSVGDANGTSYDPEPGMNALKHEVYKAEIGSIKTNAEDNNILEFEFIVPASSGGYYIREAALYAGETVCAIARLPEQYKAQASEGAGSSMTVKLLIAVTSDAKVYINIPESLQYATQTYVGERIKNHVDEDNPHTQYVKNETYTEGINELKNNKAEKTHNHDDIYSKLNHNHNDIYSQLNHNHELSSLNGVLPVNKGGTGQNSLDNLKNATLLPNDFNGTILDFFNMLPERYGATYVGLSHATKGRITDLPSTSKDGTLIIYKYLNGVNDHGQLAKIIYEVNNSLEQWYYQMYWQQNTGRWIKTRNADGTVAGVGKVTELPTGTWTETVLNDGKVLVNGYGFIYAKGQSFVEIPYTLTDPNIQVTVFRGRNDYNDYVIGAEYFKTENKIYFTASFNNKINNNLSYYWSCQGLKA